MAAMRSTASTSQIDGPFDDDDDESVDVGTDVCGVPPGVLAIVVVVGPPGCVTGVVVGVVIGVAELASPASACCGMTPVRSWAPGWPRPGVGSNDTQPTS